MSSIFQFQNTFVPKNSFYVFDELMDKTYSWDNKVFHVFIYPIRFIKLSSK